MADPIVTAPTPPVTTGNPPTPGLSSMRAGLDKFFPGGSSPPPAQTPPAPPAQPAPAATTPTPAEPPKSTTQKDMEDLVVPELGRRARREDWERAKTAAYERGRKEAETQLRENMIAKGDYEQLKKERDELHTRLASVALDQDPEFQRQFKVKQGAAVTIAREAVGPDLATQVETIMKMPSSSYKDEALDKIFEQLTPAKQARLTGAIAAFEQVEQERQARLAEAPRELEARAAQAQSVRTRAQNQLQQAFESALEDAASPDGGIDLLQEKQGDDAHNKRADYVKAMARHIYTKASADEIARAAIQAAMYEPILTDLLASKKQIEALTAELDKLRGQKPSTVTGQSSTTTTVTALPPPGQGLSGLAEGLLKRGLVRG